jgi:hypothetical protein
LGGRVIGWPVECDCANPCTRPLVCCDDLVPAERVAQHGFGMQSAPPFLPLLDPGRSVSSLETYWLPINPQFFSDLVSDNRNIRMGKLDLYIVEREFPKLPIAFRHHLSERIDLYGGSALGAGHDDAISQHRHSFLGISIYHRLPEFMFQIDDRLLICFQHKTPPDSSSCSAVRTPAPKSGLRDVPLRSAKRMFHEMPYRQPVMSLHVLINHGSIHFVGMHVIG